MPLVYVANYTVPIYNFCTERNRQVTDAKKPSPSFVVRMVGSKVRPWKVPMRKLTHAMDAVQRLIEQRDEFADDEGDESSVESTPLQLLGIVSGSAVYRVAADNPGRALSILKQTGNDINAPKSVDWTSATLSSLSDLSDVAKTLGCRVEFRAVTEDGKRLGDILAIIEPDTYSKISSSAFVTGETSVFGKIERVGGATKMRCGLRIPHQHRMVICKVASADLTRALGQFMYEHVTVHGTATWARRGSFLKELEIKSYDPPKSGSIMKTLEAVHSVSNGAWDRIKDPRAAIADMRAR